MSEPLRIDIPAVLKRKAPNAKIPHFVINYLERIVHVKQMNRFLAAHPDIKDYDFIRAILKEEFNCTVSIQGTENIPQTDQPLIFVSNHPLGALDGVIEALMIGEQRNYNLKVIVNDLLMYMTPLAGLFAPVNKVGKQSREYALQQQQMWENGTDILTFPAGACSRLQRIDGKWKIYDLQWQKNCIQKSVQYQRDIVPVYFEGQNSRFFYTLAYLRKLFKIKLNIEMLYLADEMYRASSKHFVVHVGKPIQWQTFDKSRTPLQWAEYLKNITYQIPL